MAEDRNERSVSLSLSFSLYLSVHVYPAILLSQEVSISMIKRELERRSLPEGRVPILCVLFYFVGKNGKSQSVRILARLCSRRRANAAETKGTSHGEGANIKCVRANFPLENPRVA